MVLSCNNLGDCPVFVNRTEWGARPPKSTQPLKTIPPPFVVIHHSAGRVCNETKTCEQFMRIIQTDHMDNRGWSDIGYNFIVSLLQLQKSIAERGVRYVLFFSIFKRLCLRDVLLSVGYTETRSIVRSFYFSLNN